jgi:hypothetical protein
MLIATAESKDKWNVCWANDPRLIPNAVRKKKSFLFFIFKPF